MARFWSFFTTHIRFSILLLIAILVGGVFSIMMLPKESAPEVDVPVALINTVFPGASALDVEELVTRPIESHLSSSLNRVNRITSSSRQGISSISVEFSASADIDASIQDVKDEIDSVIPELPEDAEDPVVSELDFIDQPIMFVSLSSELLTTRMREVVKYVEDEINEVSGVNRVEISGLPERQVTVVVSPEKLDLYGLTLSEVVRGISSADLTLPAGEIYFNGISYALQFEGSIERPGDVENIPIITQSGSTVFVRDLAFISDGEANESSLSRLSIEGTPSQDAVTLSVFKQQGSDLNSTSSSVRSRINELQEELTDIGVLVWFDSGKMMQDDLRNLTITGLQTVLLVLLSLFVVIGWKEALIASFSLPLSFLLAFIALYYSGNTLNFVSLFSLILAIGILVDAAIVVTEAIRTRIDEGESSKSAALSTIKAFHKPLSAGTLTTIAVFVPLFFLSGVTGEFIASIPFTVIFVLAASLFVSLAVIPLVASRFLGRGKHDIWKWESYRGQYTDRLQTIYRKYIVALLSKRRNGKRFTWILVGSFVIVLLFPIFGIVSSIFFPEEDIGFMYVDIIRPQGTVLYETDKSVRTVEEVLYEKDYIESFVSTTGSLSLFSDGTRGERYGNVTINLKAGDRPSTDIIINDIEDDLSLISNADIRVSKPAGGPPVGAPVVVNITGDNFTEIDRAVGIVTEELKSIEGTKDVRTGADSVGIQFSIEVDRARAASYGLTTSDIALALRNAVVGSTATSIREEEENIDVVVLMNLNPEAGQTLDTQNTTPDRIRSLQIRTVGGSVSLASVADIRLEEGRSVISREDGERIEKVTSDLGPGGNPAVIISELQTRLDDIELPEGVDIRYGGETEESAQAFQEMIIALFVGILLIIAILVLEFNSYRQVLFVIASVPLSLIGVMLGLAILRQPLSFPSMLGFIALSGIVVNNAIILIDVMNTPDREYRSARDRVVEASISRLRPILLTTITTVLGIIPLIFASALWAPLAIAIIFGLLFSTILTLFLIPLLYYRWYQKGYSEDEAAST